MNLLEPYKLEDIDVNRLVYTKTKITPNKKILFIKYKELNNKLKNLVFQTPTLVNLHKPNIKDGYAEIDVALEGKQDSKLLRLFNFIDNLEKKIKNDAQFYANEWFNLSNNSNINFQKIIRESSENPRGILKLKLINNNDFETELSLCKINNNNNNNKIKFDDIPENCWVKMLLECYAIWINNDNDFGVFLRPILASFSPREKLNYKYEFIKDEDSQSSDDENSFIPDTEIITMQNDIFLPISNMTAHKNDESTTQLEFNLSASLAEDTERLTEMLKLSNHIKQHSNHNNDSINNSDKDSNNDSNNDSENENDSDSDEETLSSEEDKEKITNLENEIKGLLVHSDDFNDNSSEYSSEDSLNNDEE